MGEGSWLAVVDLPGFGADAAVELGIPLERVVRVDTASPAGGAADPVAPEAAAVWIDVMGAAVDGFDLVVTVVPGALRARPAAALRKLRTRIQRRGAVVVFVGDHGAVDVDGTVSTDDDVWQGLGQGWGHLRHRTLGLAARGRRIPGERRCRVGLDPGRGLVAIPPAVRPVAG
jgi:hypothetical protein